MWNDVLSYVADEVTTETYGPNTATREWHPHNIYHPNDQVRPARPVKESYNLPQPSFSPQ
jgi:hypothetical protein